MSLWLINLLVAVITSSFQVIREESKGSAFTASEQIYHTLDEEEPRRHNPLQRMYGKTYWVWIAVIFVGLVVQCLRTADMGPRRAKFVGMCLRPVHYGRVILTESIQTPQRLW